jgi:hypothetical protein
MNKANIKRGKYMKFKKFLIVLNIVFWATLNAKPLVHQTSEIVKIIKGSKLLKALEAKVVSKNPRTQFKDLAMQIMKHLENDDFESISTKKAIQTIIKEIRQGLEKIEQKNQYESIKLYQEGQSKISTLLTGGNSLGVIFYCGQISRSKSIMDIYLMIQVELLYHMIHSGHFDYQEIEALKASYLNIQEKTLSNAPASYDASWLTSEEYGLLKRLEIF